MSNKIETSNAPSEEQLLKIAVDNVLTGSYTDSLGQWQLVAYVIGTSGEHRSNGEEQQRVADTIGTRFRTAVEQANTKGLPVQNSIPKGGMPSKQTVSAWGKIGSLLVDHVFTDDSLTALKPQITDKPGTVWNRANKHFGTAAAATVALTEQGAAAKFIDDYQAIVNAINEADRLAAAEKRTKDAAARKLAKEHAKEQDNSTVPVAAADSPADSLTEALNAAISTHGLGAVTEAVTAALEALDAQAANAAAAKATKPRKRKTANKTATA